MRNEAYHLERPAEIEHFHCVEEVDAHVVGHGGDSESGR